MIVTGPDLILPDIRHIDRILLHGFRQHTDKLRRIYISRIRLSYPRHGGTICIQSLNPLFMVTGKGFPVKVFKNMPCITHQRDGWPYILTDLCRIHIDMYQHLIFRD